MPLFHEIQGPELPWGDYGNMLFHGMNDNDIDEAKFPVKLWRTGPFVSDLTRPWGYLIVSDRVRQALEQTSFHGIDYADVVLDRIVDVNWHDWDRTADDPLRFPAGGEPENYIGGRKHNERIASQMPKLWALDVARIKHAPKLTTFDREGIDPEVDIFEFAWTFYVSPPLKNWLKDMVPDCVTFSRARRLLE